MYIHLMVAIPDRAKDAGSGGPEGNNDKLSPTQVDLSGNVQAASQLERAIRGRGWRHDVVILGPVKRRPFGIPDLIVNCICDPSFHRRSLEIVAELVGRFRVPVLNHPWAVMGTSRARGSYTLGHQVGVNMPLTTHFVCTAGSLAEHLERHGHTLPVLGRPAGAHGGKGLARIDRADFIPDELAGLDDFLVTDFVDYASPDGLYRKYRVIYVNDRLFRRHVVISDSWKVAGQSRLVMKDRPELIDEEKAFIAGQGGDFEARLIHQFRALHLDFGVCDFAIAEDGTVTIFEINPCFQLTASIPDDKREKWGYLEENNEVIVEALLDTMADRVANPL